MAIVGHGSWATRFIVPGLRESPRAELVALCGRDLERTRAAAVELQVASHFTDLGRLLEVERPDAVFVVTPTAAHAEAALAALAAGCHVFCEKPLASSVEESARLTRAAAPVRSAVGFSNRWSPALRQLRERLRAGEIGPVRRVALDYLQSAFHDPARPPSWRTDAAAEPLGALGDTGAHAVDLLLWLVGPVERVAGSGRTLYPSRSNLDECRVQIAFECGAEAELFCSRVASPAAGRAQHELEILGQRGSLAYSLADAGAFTLRRGGQVSRIEVTPAPEGADPAEFERQMALGRHRQLDEVLRHFAGERVRPDFPTFEAGHECQRVLEAAAQAIDTGGWTALPPSALGRAS